jgi:arsenate reductase
LKIYLYANCSSCRTAEVVLAESGLGYDRRDIFKNRLAADEIRELLAMLGKQPADILSRCGVPYRELDLASRLVSEDELIELIAEHPALMQRPIVAAGEKPVVGFSDRALNNLIAKSGAN